MLWLCACTTVSFSVHRPTLAIQSALARPVDVRRAQLAMAEPAPIVADDIWTLSPSSMKNIQGDTLKTWDIGEQTTERVQLSIRSHGRPINSKVELWHTPSYIPTYFRVYSEDGKTRPITAIIETPKHPKTVAVYNKASLDFPFDATVVKTGMDKAYTAFSGKPAESVQGGRIISYTFGQEVESVQVLLKTGERNMKAKIELTQGPNQTKQVIELYASSGYKNPFFTIIQTPGSVSTIRIINQNTVEFPFDAWVLPYKSMSADASEPLMGGGGF